MAIKRVKLVSALHKKNLEDSSNPQQDVVSELQRISVENESGHKDIKESVENFKDLAQDIKSYTKETIEVLQSLRKDNNAHHEIIASLHKDSAEHLQLISGKKQVPLSIFAIVTVLLCGLLVASEVRFSGLDVEISTSGIHVSKGHNTSTTKQ